MAPELLAPVGNFESLQAAIDAGADSVYLGCQELNMRTLGSSNFSFEELKEAVIRAHAKKVRVYLTVNSIIYPNEDSLLDKTLQAAKDTGVDAIIAWDLMVLQKAKALGLELHLSTQASVANFEALKFYYDFGIKRFVLARELDLEQIKKIIAQIKKEKLDAEIECFIHGAMCIAVSGRCFMSQITCDKSANRGECIQVCRRKYKITDVEEDVELELDNQYVMSPKDMCTMPIIEQIIDSGISVFKIEGRARSPEYVKGVVEAYREAIDLHIAKKLTEKKKKELITKMERVYNRGFETGFYMGKPIHAWAGVYGSKATTRKMLLGKISNYYSKSGVAEVKIESNSIAKGDVFYVMGPTTGVIEGQMPEMVLNDKFVSVVKKGDLITFKVPKCRMNDKFYKVVEVKGNEDLVQNH
jgi:U32 family peptidase